MKIRSLPSWSSIASGCWSPRSRERHTRRIFPFHVYGEGSLIERDDELSDVLARSVRDYEGSGGWSMEQADPDWLFGLAKGIVGFRVRITRMEGNWKLSQHHSAERRMRVIDALQSKGDEHAWAIAALMRDTLK